MKEIHIPSDINANVNKMFKKLQEKQGIRTLESRLSNCNDQFWDYFLELCVGYALKNYHWQYENKGPLGKRDFSFCEEKTKVFIEVKNRNKTESEKKLEGIRQKALNVLKDKSGRKYLCALHLKDIPVDIDEDGKPIFDAWEDKILCRLSKISSNQVKKDNAITLLEEVWYGKRSLREYESEVTLEFLGESEKWDVVLRESGEVNDWFSFELLRDFLDSLLYVFEKRTTKMITIGIINVTAREFIFPIEKSFDPGYGKGILEEVE